MTTKVIFLTVRTSLEKMDQIAKTAEHHWKQKEPLLFLVTDQKGREFLDHFLWAYSPDSFLPHPSPLLDIRLDVDPLFPTVFNLSSQAVFATGVQTVYELEDHTSAQKRERAQERYAAYRERSFQIIAP